MEMRLTCASCNSLGSNDGNFVPNTDEAKKAHARIHFLQSKMFVDGLTEDEIFRRCFVIRQPKVERSEIECHKSLTSLCKTLLKQQPKGATIVCNICGVAIAKNKFSMISHIHSHLEVNLFHCRHCDYSSSHRSCVRKHLCELHSLVSPAKEDIEDKTIEYFDEVFDQIKRCFSANIPRVVTTLQLRNRRCRKKSQQSINRLCRSIFIQRSKPEIIECNCCGLVISLRGRGKGVIALYQHAASHLEIKLFKCRHCQRLVSTKLAMFRHFTRVHQMTKGNSDDFEDLSEKFLSKYLDMINRCFSDKKVKREAPSVDDESKTEAAATIRIHTNGSKLAVARQSFYLGLMKKILDPDGKVKCSLCSRRLSVKLPSRTTSRVAYLHAETHVQKPLYRCKVCGIQLNTQCKIASHLTLKHALGLRSGKNHENDSDEFHEEIMATLMKCYDVECL